jgi:hypothetical protein
MKFAISFSFSLLGLFAGAAAQAQIAVIALENKVKLVNGAAAVQPNPPSDGMAVCAWPANHAGPYPKRLNGLGWRRSKDRSSR